MPSILREDTGDAKPQTNGDVNTPKTNADLNGNHDDAFQHLPKPQQDILLLHGPRQKYRLEKAREIPEIQSDREILVQVRRWSGIWEESWPSKVVAIGLNPVVGGASASIPFDWCWLPYQDWKGPYVSPTANVTRGVQEVGGPNQVQNRPSWPTHFLHPLVMSKPKTDQWYSDYDFGLPSFPWVNGRDFAGIVVKTFKGSSRVKAGDLVRFRTLNGGYSGD